jgi:hypothetical protein
MIYNLLSFKEYLQGEIKHEHSCETGNLGYTERKEKKTQTQHNRCWTPLNAYKHNNVNRTYIDVVISLPVFTPMLSTFWITDITFTRSTHIFNNDADNKLNRFEDKKFKIFEGTKSKHR